MAKFQTRELRKKIKLHLKDVEGQILYWIASNGSHPFLTQNDPASLIIQAVTITSVLSQRGSDQELEDFSFRLHGKDCMLIAVDKQNGEPFLLGANPKSVANRSELFGSPGVA